jgi:hypothetical protein
MGKLKAIAELFEGRHFDREVIILCVRWYLRFKLSLHDLVEMMAERGLPMAHTTIMRWVQRYAPEFEKRWCRFARAVGRSWRVDETYVKIRGEWCYLVAQRQAKHPLPNQSSYRVLNQIRRSVVGETAGKPLDQADRPVSGAKQHRSPIRGHLAAVKPGHHRPARDRCKTKQIHATLCLHRASPDSDTNRCYNTISSDSAARCTYPFEKSGLTLGADLEIRVVEMIGTPVQRSRNSVSHRGVP